MGESSISPSDRFAFKLFRELTRGGETSNVIFSPFSVMLCLLMLWEGAAGETRDAMSRVLEIAAEDLEPSQRYLRILKLRQLLSSRSPSATPASSSPSPVPSGATLGCEFNPRTSRK